MKTLTSNVLNKQLETVDN